MPKDVILTPEGLEKLTDELEILRTDRRREVAERIKEAREFGDITENSEYDDAKNEQAMLEARIATLEEKLGAAQVIDAAEISTEAVQIGSVVHVKDEKTGKSQKFTIVGSAEANPSEQRLSNESPVGKALIGHKRGEIVSVQVPRGPARKLKITKIDVGLYRAPVSRVLRHDAPRLDSPSGDDPRGDVGVEPHETLGVGCEDEQPTVRRVAQCAAHQQPPVGHPRAHERDVRRPVRARRSMRSSVA